MRQWPPETALRVGIAGWALPPAHRSQRSPDLSQLQYYAQHFGAVEINSSFYRSHRHDTYQRWARDTPADFQFSVKLPRTITHDAQLRGSRHELNAFLGEVSGLGRKLKIILVQLPPSLEFNASAARRVFAILHEKTRARIVCEPRHISWFNEGAERAFERYGVARVAADPVRHPDADTPAGYSGVEYFRLHGAPRIYYSAYSAECLEALAAKLTTAPRRRNRKAWVIFDNTARYEAWPDAERLQAMLRRNSTGDLRAKGGVDSSPGLANSV